MSLKWHQVQTLTEMHHGRHRSPHRPENPDLTAINRHIAGLRLRGIVAHWWHRRPFRVPMIRRRSSR